MKCLVSLWLSLLFSVLFTHSWAQENKTNCINATGYIYIDELQYSNKSSIASILTGALQGKVVNQEKNYLPSLKAAILKGVSQVARLVLKEEALDETMGDFTQSTSQPCYLLETTVTSIGTTTEFSKVKNGNNSYYGIVVFTLNLKNLKTSEIVASREFKTECSSYTYNPSAEKALIGAIDLASSKVNSYFNRIFPICGNLLEKGLEKKSKLKEVYIDLGTNYKLHEGKSFIVYSVSNIAGKEVKREIGKVKVKEVMGDDISLCKVTKGGDIIKAILEKGEKAVVVSQ